MEHQVRTHDTPCLPSQARIASRTRWERFANRLRKHVRLACGLSPELPPAPLHCLRATAYRGDGYAIERLALETLPNFYLTGSLFVPSVPAGKRAPAMLQPHGHFPKGRLNLPDILRAVALARAGVWVLMYDMVGYNDAFQLLHHGAEPLEWRRWGFSRAGLQTWNSLCAYQWLRQQPPVDPKRIGCSGISGGGTQTFLLSAVEPRLACAIPLKMVSTMMQGGCICENPPLLRLFACNPEITALTAPRPLLLLSDRGDWTHDNPERVAPYLQSVYRLSGAETAFEHHAFQEGHEFGTESRTVYYRWLANLWRLAHGPSDPTENVAELELYLRVWSQELPKPEGVPTGEGVFEVYRGAVESSLKRWWRSRRFRSEAQEALLSLLGWESLPMPSPDALSEVRSVLGSKRMERVVVVVGAETGRAQRWVRKGYARLVIPLTERKPLTGDYPYKATYNLTPDTRCAQEVCQKVQAVRAIAERVVMVAEGEGAVFAGIASALLELPSDLGYPDPKELEGLDIPCWERIGGLETLRRITHS